MSTSAYKVRINTQTTDSEALILLDEGALVGVLVELSEECHGSDRGNWAIEAIFTIDSKRVPTLFPSALEAADWISAHLPCGRFILDEEVVQLR